MLTLKDRLILAQSQLERAIELTQVVGFPDGVETYSQKMKYVTQELTPKLIKITIANAKNSGS